MRYRELNDCAADCRMLKALYHNKEKVGRWTYGKFLCDVTTVRNPQLNSNVETCCTHKRSDGVIECCGCHKLRNPDGSDYEDEAAKLLWNLLREEGLI